MVRKIFMLSIGVGFCIKGIAQPVLHWPEDTAKAQEMVALYSDALKNQHYEEAISPFEWLLENAPNLNLSLYVNGEKLYKALASEVTDRALQQKYQERVLALYDLRIRHFQDTGSVMHRKAHAAYQYYKNREEKYEALFSIFETAFQVGKAYFTESALVAYMDVIRLYKLENGNLSDAEILNRYSQITEVLQQRKEPDNADDIDKKQALVDGLLLKTIEMDCTTISERFGAPFLEQENDLVKAKRIVALSLAYKCKDLPVFLKAAKVVQRHDPDFGLAKLIAIMSDARQEYETAERYYLEAESLASDTAKKAEIHYALALHYQRRGMKASARNHALKAADVDQYRKDANKMIGDLYFSSYEACKEEESTVSSRAIYIAAYEMYKKAGHTEMMEAARAQFPSREEVFQETYAEGQTIKAGCWINENVKIQCRPEQQ